MKRKKRRSPQAAATVGRTTTTVLTTTLSCLLLLSSTTTTTLGFSNLFYARGATTRASPKLSATSSNSDNNNNNWQDLAAQWASRNRDGAASAASAAAPSQTNAAPQNNAATTPQSSSATVQQQPHETQQSSQQQSSSQQSTSLAQEWLAMNRGQPRNQQQQPNAPPVNPHQHNSNQNEHVLAETERQAAAYAHLTQQNMSVLGAPTGSMFLNQIPMAQSPSAAGSTRNADGSSATSVPSAVQQEPPKTTSNAQQPWSSANLAAEWAQRNRDQSPTLRPASTWSKPTTGNEPHRQTVAKHENLNQPPPVEPPLGSVNTDAPTMNKGSTTSSTSSNQAPPKTSQMPPKPSWSSAAVLAKQWANMNQERDFYATGRNNHREIVPPPSPPEPPLVQPEPQTKMEPFVNEPETKPPVVESPPAETTTNDANMNTGSDLATEWAARNQEPTFKDRPPRSSSQIPASASEPDQPKTPPPMDEFNFVPPVSRRSETPKGPLDANDVKSNAEEPPRPPLSALAREWAALSQKPPAVDEPVESQQGPPPIVESNAPPPVVESQQGPPPVVESKPKTIGRRHVSSDDLIGNQKPPVKIATPSQVEQPPVADDKNQMMSLFSVDGEPTSKVAIPGQGSLGKDQTNFVEKPRDIPEEKNDRVSTEPVVGQTANPEKVNNSQQDAPPKVPKDNLQSTGIPGLFLDERPPSVYSTVPTKTTDKVNVPPRAAESKKEPKTTKRVGGNASLSASQRLYIDPNKKTHNIRMNPDKYVDKDLNERMNPTLRTGEDLKNGYTPPVSTVDSQSRSSSPWSSRSVDPTPWNTNKDFEETIVEDPLRSSSSSPPYPGGGAGAARNRMKQFFNATLALSVDVDIDQLQDKDTSKITQAIRETFSQGSLERDDPPYRDLSAVSYIGVLDVAAGQKLGFWVEWNAFEETKLDSFMERLNVKLVEAKLRNATQSTATSTSTATTTKEKETKSDRKEATKVPEDWLSKRASKEDGPMLAGSVMDACGNEEAYPPTAVDWVAAREAKEATKPSKDDWLAARVKKEDSPQLPPASTQELRDNQKAEADWLAQRLSQEEPRQISGISPGSESYLDEKDLYSSGGMISRDEEMPATEEVLRPGPKEKMTASERKERLKAAAAEAERRAKEKELAKERAKARLQAEKDESLAQPKTNDPLLWQDDDAFIVPPKEPTKYTDEEYAAQVLAIEEARMKAEGGLGSSFNDISDLKGNVETEERIVAEEEHVQMLPEEQDNEIRQALSKFRDEEAAERARLFKSDSDSETLSQEAVDDFEQSESFLFFQDTNDNDDNGAISEPARLAEDINDDSFEEEASRELKLVENNARALVEAAENEAAEAEEEALRLSQAADDVLAKIKEAEESVAAEAKAKEISAEEAQKKAWEEEKARLKAEAQENFRSRAESGLNDRQKSFFSLNNPTGRQRYNATIALSVETDPHSLSPQDISTVNECIKATFSQGSPDSSDPPFRQVTDVSFIGIFDVQGSERLGYWVSWTAYEESSLSSFMERLNAELDHAPLSRPVTKNAKKNGGPLPRKNQKQGSGRSTGAESAEQRKLNEQLQQWEMEHARLEKAAANAKENAQRLVFAVSEAQTRAESEVEAATARAARLRAHAKSKARVKLSGPGNMPSTDSTNRNDQEKNPVEGKNLLSSSSRKQSIQYDDSNHVQKIIKASIRLHGESVLPLEKRLSPGPDPSDEEPDEFSLEEQQSDADGETSMNDREAKSLDRKPRSISEMIQQKKQEEAMRVQLELEEKTLHDLHLDESVAKEDALHEEENVIESEKMDSDAQGESYTVKNEFLSASESLAKSKEEEELRARNKALLLEQEAILAENRRLKEEAKKRAEEERKAVESALRLEKEARSAEIERARVEAEKRAKEEQKAIEEAIRIESEARRAEDARKKAAAEKQAEDDRRARKEADRQAKLAALSQQRARLARDAEERSTASSKDAEEAARARHGWLGRQPPQEKVGINGKRWAPPASNVPKVEPVSAETKIGDPTTDLSSDLPVVSKMPAFKTQAAVQPKIKREPLSKANSLPKNTQPLLHKDDSEQSKRKAFVRAAPSSMNAPESQQPPSLKDFSATLALSVDSFSNFLTPKDTATVAKAIWKAFGQGNKDAGDPDFREVSAVEYVGTNDADSVAGKQLQYRISWTAFGDTNLDSFMERLNKELASTFKGSSKDENAKPTAEEEQLDEKPKGQAEEARKQQDDAKIARAAEEVSKKEAEIRQRALLANRLQSGTQAEQNAVPDKAQADVEREKKEAESRQRALLEARLISQSTTQPAEASTKMETKETAKEESAETVQVPAPKTKAQLRMAQTAEANTKKVGRKDTTKEESAETAKVPAPKTKAQLRMEKLEQEAQELQKRLEAIREESRLAQEEEEEEQLRSVGKLDEKKSDDVDLKAEEEATKKEISKKANDISKLETKIEASLKGAVTGATKPESKSEQISAEETLQGEEDEKVFIKSIKENVKSKDVVQEVLESAVDEKKSDTNTTNKLETEVAKKIENDSGDKKSISDETRKTEGALEAENNLTTRKGFSKRKEKQKRNGARKPKRDNAEKIKNRKSFEKSKQADNAKRNGVAKNTEVQSKSNEEEVVQNDESSEASKNDREDDWNGLDNFLSKTNLPFFGRKDKKKD